MAIWNLGSINADLVYALPHLPEAGETLAAFSLDKGLGGKGANQSIALAKAGCDVSHVGAISEQDEAILAQIAKVGVDTSLISRLNIPTGHAIIQVNPDADEVDDFLARYPKAQVRDFDGDPSKVSELDAMIAYLQMLGTLVDFASYDAEAGKR